jgi:DNA-binding NtrC family response regulator
MKKVLSLTRRVAPSNMTVLLTGETGTGKDLLARYIHHYSGCRGKFVPVNAAAIPNDLVEAELFGHCQGAFTNAVGDRTGLIEQADRGTLYLNEIADTSPQFQAKLLEVIETKEVRRLGGNGSRPLSVRIIAATNHDLQQRIADGLFRLDLYHRLNEIPIELPPLSERPEDIAPLVRHFLERIGDDGPGHKDGSKLADALFGKSWPGNVRELEAVVKGLWLSSGGNVELMLKLAAQRRFEDDRAGLLSLLEETDWNRREVARRLGVSEATVRKRISRYNLSGVRS